MNNSENTNSFFLGCLFGGIFVVVVIFLFNLFHEIALERIEENKTEKLTIIYKNTNRNIDKNIAINIAKTMFPTSNWTNIENKANKNRAEFNAWSTMKK